MTPTVHTYLDEGITILKTHLQSSQQKIRLEPKSTIQPFITISREACAGADSLARELIPLLNAQAGTEGRSWMFFDKDLITHALTKHNLPERLAEFLPEDRISEIKSLVGELVGLHPPVWELEHKVSDAILQLAVLGCVILTGRASNYITQSQPGGLHLRLVASLAVRIQRMKALKQCDESTAKNIILSADQARERYVRTNFQKDIDDPHGYDLVINTDHITPQSAAQLVISAFQDRLQLPQTTDRQQ